MSICSLYCFSTIYIFRHRDVSPLTLHCLNGLFVSYDLMQRFDSVFLTQRALRHLMVVAFWRQLRDDLLRLSDLMQRRVFVFLMQWFFEDEDILYYFIRKKIIPKDPS